MLIHSSIKQRRGQGRLGERGMTTVKFSFRGILKFYTDSEKVGGAGDRGRGFVCRPIGLIAQPADRYILDEMVP